MEELLIYCHSVPNSLLCPLFFVTHVPLLADVMLGFANRGCWKASARRYPSFSLPLLLLPHHLLLWGRLQTGSRRCTPFLRGGEQPQAGCPTSKFLPCHPVQPKGWYLLSAIAASLCISLQGQLLPLTYELLKKLPSSDYWYGFRCGFRVLTDRCLLPALAQLS